MHVQTHVLSGWCLGNLVPGLGPRERLMCMAAAGIADLDGLGILVSQDLYWDLHHKLGHCALFGVVAAGLLAAFSSPGRRLLGFGMYLALFHLHLVMDYFGSGPDWPIWYLWPFCMARIEHPDPWPFFSWQNILAAFAMVAWTLWIAVRHGRTPLEALMPSLDEKLVTWLRREGTRRGKMRRETSVSEAKG